MTLKVYGIHHPCHRAAKAPNGSYQVRVIVATTSQRRAAEILKTSLSDIRKYGSQTWNAEDIRVATANPETAMFFDEYGSRTWKPVQEPAHEAR